MHFHHTYIQAKKADVTSGKPDEAVCLFIVLGMLVLCALTGPLVYHAHTSGPAAELHPVYQHISFIASNDKPTATAIEHFAQNLPTALRLNGKNPVPTPFAQGKNAHRLSLRAGLYDLTKPRLPTSLPHSHTETFTFQEVISTSRPIRAGPHG